MKNRKNIPLGRIGRYFATGLLSVAVVPALGISSLMFLVGALSVVVVSVLNFIGLTDAPFYVGTMRITGITQIIAAIIVAVLLCALAYQCWKGIKKFNCYVKEKRTPSITKARRR